jgi:hypothetical protein
LNLQVRRPGGNQPGVSGATIPQYLVNEPPDSLRQWDNTMQNSVSKIMSAKALTFSAALLALAVPALAVGCSSAPSGTGTVGATAVVLNRSTHALMAGALLDVDGTYGTGCSGHMPGAPWSVSVIGTDLGAGDPALSVDPADTGCVLTLTTLDTNAGSYVTNADIVLAAGFAPTASLFTLAGLPSFYANADLNPITFSGPVTIIVETSDDPFNFGTTTVPAVMAVVGSATQSDVAAPAYTPSGTLTVVDNASHLVQSATGTVTLAPTVLAGDAYVLLQTTDPFTPTFDSDQTDFGNGPGLTLPQMFDAATLVGPIGTLLPETATIIIQRTDGAGVKTYETIQYQFNP